MGTTQIGWSLGSLAQAAHSSVDGRLGSRKRDNSSGESMVEGEPLRTAGEVKREIARRYSADPGGWQVLYGRSPGGSNDLIVVHGSDVWIVKEDPVNPYESVGLGAKGRLRKGEEIERFSPYPFGLRPLSSDRIQELMARLMSGKGTRETMKQIMKIKPSSPRDIRSPVVVQGPVVYSQKPIELISDSHKELSEKLDEQLQKLLYRKYPSRMGMYR